MVVAVAPVTLEHLKIRPDFPINFSPRNSISFSNESYEFLEVPSSINHMLGPHLAVIVNIALGLVAVKDLALAHCKQLITVGALIEIVPFFFKE